MAHHSDNQPRVPAGNPDGGEWTSENRGETTEGKSKSTATSSNNDNRTVSSLYVDSMVSNNPVFNEIEKEALSYIKGRRVPKERKSGVRDVILSEMAEAKGYSGTPQRLGKEEIVQSLTKKGGNFWYRGLADPKYAKEFYNGELWMGRGFFGNGIYMAPDEIEASSYGKSIVVAIVDNDMKFAPSNIVEQRKAFLQYLREKQKHIDKVGTIEQIDEYESLYTAMTDMGKFALLCGYDAYYAGHNIVVLNRTKLKIGERDETLEQVVINH